MEPTHASGQRRTFVLVDGENIDVTLGSSVLGRRPSPEERPRWERVTDYAQTLWGQPVVGLFFLNASQGNLPTPFIQALLAMGYRPIPLSGGSDEKVVDIGIQRTLDALVRRQDDDFAPHMKTLMEDGRRVGLLGFREFASTHLTGLGLPLYDLEDDVAAFNSPLPRVRVIALDDFDPDYFLR